MPRLRDAAGQDPDGEHRKLYLSRVPGARDTELAWAETDSAFSGCLKRRTHPVGRGTVMANLKVLQRDNTAATQKDSDSRARMPARTIS
jgi:hypothetical protein